MLWLEMSPHPALERLREQLSCLEETQRRFARLIPIAEGVDGWMPHGGLPAACIHEVKSASLASALGFASILSARAAGAEGDLVYIAAERSLYALGLLPYGVKLEQLLFVRVRRAQDLAWAVMEAIRCSQVSAVMAELDELDLTDSRRLQLAAESSGVTCFLLGRANSAQIAAPITRWRVSPKVGTLRQRFDDATWTLDLLYCRGGRPGSWTVEWREQRLSTLFEPAVVVETGPEALAG